jgi:uncharacterized protein (DUF736 family)
MEEIIGQDVKDLEEYEEVSAAKQGGSEQEQRKGRRPDFRIVQPDTNQDGSKVFKSVGAMWKSVSKNGKEFYVLKIGELRLLVFTNEPKGGDYGKTQ